MEFRLQILKHTEYSDYLGRPDVIMWTFVSGRGRQRSQSERCGRKRGRRGSKCEKDPTSCCWL